MGQLGWLLINLAAPLPIRSVMSCVCVSKVARGGFSPQANCRLAVCRVCVSKAARRLLAAGQLPTDASTRARSRGCLSVSWEQANLI